jgi:hypothetical protein
MEDPVAKNPKTTSKPDDIGQVPIESYDSGEDLEQRLEEHFNKAFELMNESASPCLSAKKHFSIATRALFKRLFYAANEGRFHVSFEDEIPLSVLKKLEDNGYYIRYTATSTIVSCFPKTH